MIQILGNVQTYCSRRNPAVLQPSQSQCCKYSSDLHWVYLSHYSLYQIPWFLWQCKSLSCAWLNSQILNGSTGFLKCLLQKDCANAFSSYLTKFWLDCTLVPKLALASLSDMALCILYFSSPGPFSENNTYFNVIYLECLGLMYNGRLVQGVQAHMSCIRNSGNVCITSSMLSVHWVTESEFYAAVCLCRGD